MVAHILKFREYNPIHILNSYATNRKVASSIPDEVIFFLNVPDPSGRIRTWGLLTLTEISTRKKNLNNVSGE
jgi:hypothetical protein